MLALAVCAFTAAGHDSPTAIAEWAADCSGEALLILGGRPDPLTRRVWPPSTRTFRRVLGKINADALNQALYGFVEVMPPAAPGELPEVTRHEREQRRAAAAAREPAVPGLLPHAAADGKTARGAVRPDGSQVHLLSACHVTEDRTMAQREVDAETNEIAELLPMPERLDLGGMVITADALHGQRETARKIREDLGAHYVMVIKANQPSLLEAITAQAQRHRRRVRGHHLDRPGQRPRPPGEAHHPHRPRRRHRLAARRPGPAHPPRHRPHPRPVGRQGDRPRHHQPPRSHRRTPPPRHLRTPALGNRKQGTLRPRRHIPGGRTETRTGNQPSAHAGIRNPVMGAFRRKGHADIAAARRYYGRDDQRILALYGYL